MNKSQMLRMTNPIRHFSMLQLKAQMAILLKGHTHLQAEFWVFFEELHPPTAHPGQFEESHWPESGDSQVCRGEAAGGFEEVSLPDLEEEAEGYKIQPMTSRRQRRKLGAHKNYKVSKHLSSVKNWNHLFQTVDQNGKK